MLLADPNDRVFGVLAGRPNAEDWDGVISEMSEAMVAASKSPGVPAHNRGNYAAINAGLSFGGGQRVSK